MQGWIELISKFIAMLIIATIPILLIKIIKGKIEEFIIKIDQKKYEKWLDETPIIELTEEQGIKSQNNEYKNSYEPKYLMTLNEKAQFRKLQAWAQGRGLIIFSKIRLLDLIAPRKEQDNYKGLLWKIQAKHVDFVICDKDIKVKCIIEINDNSHKQADRSERDKFVTEVLQACGYKVLQTYNVTENQLDQICDCIQ